MRVLFIVLCFLLFSTSVMAANVTLRWDCNDPTPEGYRVFLREAGNGYNYSTPIWDSDSYDQTCECTLIELAKGTTYYFVVRAYDGELESADSEEVTYTPLSDDDSTVLNVPRNIRKLGE